MIWVEVQATHGIVICGIYANLSPKDGDKIRDKLKRVTSPPAIPSQGLRADCTVTLPSCVNGVWVIEGWELNFERLYIDPFFGF